MSMKHINC